MAGSAGSATGSTAVAAAGSAGTFAWAGAGVGWRPKLSLRHKSISLDNPEVQGPGSGPGQPGHSGPGSSPAYSSTGKLPNYSQSPSSPVQARNSGAAQHLNNRGPRCEVDRNSPLSTSPGQSPMKARQLPTSIYAVLYNFQPRRQDELGLAAGSTVHILDTSDSDWWRGRCTITGSVGFLPSTYLARTLPSERVFRVTHPCNLVSKSGEIISLVRDQIVLGLPPSEGDQQIIVRTGESSQPSRGRVPLRYLSSV